MKIREYNQVMAYLTRPGQDSNALTKSSTDNISKSKTSSGVKSLAKNKALMKKLREPKVRDVDFGLGSAAFESSLPDDTQFGEPATFQMKVDDFLKAKEKSKSSAQQLLDLMKKYEKPSGGLAYLMGLTEGE